MSAIRIVCATLALSLTGAAAQNAQAASIGLDIKTGLWEMTSTGKTKGRPAAMLPAEVLKHLSPSQRSQMNSVMSEGMKHADKKRVSKKCVTEKTLKRGFKLDDKPSTNCKETLVTNNAKLMEMRLHCTGTPRADGSYRMEAVGHEEVRGIMTMKVKSGGGYVTMNRDMKGHWLGPDCGNVKPD